MTAGDQIRGLAAEFHHGHRKSQELLGVSYPERVQPFREEHRALVAAGFNPLSAAGEMMRLHCSDGSLSIDVQWLIYAALVEEITAAADLLRGSELVP